MTEDRLRSTISGYPDIIEGVEELEIIQKSMVSRLKAKLRLFDGSVLLIREIWIKGEMTAYSYYWLRSNETVIIGWDNAPHHKDVGTFPHRKHISDRVEDSQERKLGGDELEFVKEAFESNYIAPLGPMVDAFEREFGEHVGITHCAAVSSGTAAMHLGLRHLMQEAGGKNEQRSEVFVSTLTFIGSVMPVVCDSAEVVGASYRLGREQGANIFPSWRLCAR